MSLFIRFFYVSTRGNVSFYRTGYGGAVSIADGGALVIPRIHKFIEVNHEIFNLSLDLSGQSAKTADDLDVEVRFTCFMFVEKTKEAIRGSATYFNGGHGSTYDIYSSEFNRVAKEAIRKFSKEAIQRDRENLASMIKIRIQEECSELMSCHTLHSVKIVEVK